jgi:hypothetical protein
MDTSVIEVDREIRERYKRTHEQSEPERSEEPEPVVLPVLETLQTNYENRLAMIQAKHAEQIESLKAMMKKINDQHLEELKIKDAHIEELKKNTLTDTQIQNRIAEIQTKVKKITKVKRAQATEEKFSRLSSGKTTVVRPTS